MIKGNNMKKFYLTYKDYQSLDSNAVKEMQNLVNSLLLSRKKRRFNSFRKRAKIYFRWRI